MIGIGSELVRWIWVGQLHIGWVRDDAQKVALFLSKFWQIGGGWPCGPPQEPPFERIGWYTIYNSANLLYMS